MSYYNPPSTPSVYENERGELVVDDTVDPVQNPMFKTFKKLKTGGDQQSSSSGKGSSSQKSRGGGGRNDYITPLPGIKNPPSWAMLNAGVPKRCYGCDQGWGKDIGVSSSSGGGNANSKSLWEDVDEALDENIFTCGATHAVNEIFEIIQARRLAHDSSYSEGAYEEFTKADIINHLDKHSASLKWRLRRQLDRTSALLARLMAGDTPPTTGEELSLEDELRQAPLFSKEERETYIKLQEDQRKTMKDIEALKKTTT